MARRFSRLLGSPRAPEAPAPALPGAARSAEDERLASRVSQLEWYHTIELRPGIVTPGFFDHRPHLAHYHLPASLAGQRALDVATYNGFWAFEFERRGAREVVGLDIDTFADIDLAPARRAAMSPELLNRKVGTRLRARPGNPGLEGAARGGQRVRASSPSGSGPSTWCSAATCCST